ncbi:MAG: CoA transferase, partial [Nocardioides sp.]
TGSAPGRMGNRHPSIAPYETLRCADGMLAVACGNDGQFARMCAVLDRPDLADDPRFATNPARVRHRRELVEAVEKELALQEVAVWAERLTAVGVAAGAVNDIGGAIELAHRLGLSPTTSIGDGHPDHIRHPITWSRSPLRTPTPPPALGAHSTQLRTQLEGTS